MTPATPRILVIGDVMRDVVVRPAGPLRPGTDQRAAIEARPGGGGANLAAWLAAAGVSVRLLAGVGQADLDREACRLRAACVEPALVASPDLPTGTLIALLGPDGDRSFLTDRGANDALDAVPAGALDDIGWLHVSGYSFVGPRTRATVLALLERARAGGLPISFDPGSSAFLAEIGAEAVMGWTAGAAVCCLSADEAQVLTGRSRFEDQVEALLAAYSMAIVKDGPRGVRAAAAGGRLWAMPAPDVSVRDTIGAGDAFLAGALAAMVAREPAEVALARGTAFAARALAQVGGAPPVVFSAERST